MLQPDAQLLRDVRRELGSDHSIDASAIHVAVQDGVVVLSGSVANVGAREAAASAARRVPDVRRVFEKISVRPVDPALDDAAIAARVHAILDLDAAVPTGAVDVAVDKGFVTLTGEVDWPYEREAARSATSRIAGVTGVACRIETRGPPSVADLRGRILAALEGLVEAQAAAIEIAVEDGVVQLAGMLGGTACRDAAERAVREAPGVRSVESHLTGG
ncbi:BON domain-containing protein [Sphingomonas sp. LB-2]|uniref:BON domain-containing protein n=1 Tax=Sphingomonas caeni TaxID=2984949 RepID=UPI002232C6DC|nr:BON domain-containing protein [Sphingomonas caeni]MCW3846014.1 BON domain-containing protein [Sphingomonas caeni]